MNKEVETLAGGEELWTEERGRVMVADPNAVAGTVVASWGSHGAFLSRGRREARIGDEWAPEWAPATAGTVDVAPAGHTSEMPPLSRVGEEGREGRVAAG